MEHLLHALVIGTGATAVMDAWGWARQPLLGWPRFDYALLGRWFAHLTRGRIRHASIAHASPVPGERLIGWTMHYLIGAGFALLLLMVWGVAWIDHPTLGPALLVGVGTVAAPLMVMQPAMGAGFASSRTPHPVRARLQSLVTHFVYGVGLYAAAWLDHWFIAP